MTDNDSQSSSRIDIDADTVVYSSRNVTVGINDAGEGYVEFSVGPDSVHRFEVSTDQIEAFVATRRDEAPAPPSPPEEALSNEDVSVPDGWNHVGLQHTGGGIWLRVFRKELTEDNYLEVGYNPRTLEGVDASAYSITSGFCGVVAEVPLNDPHTETEDYPDNEATPSDALSEAQDLMTDINDEAYADRIAVLTEG